jgi:hypothetical protein
MPMKSPVARLVLLLALWGAAAAFAGAFGLLARLPPVGAQALIAGLTIGFSVALARVAWLRAAGAAVSVRTILAVHVFRFVGAYFLWLHARGRLPAEFAHRAGWGDIIAAGAALVLLFPADGPRFRRLLFWWNLVGAADLLLAVGTAAWLNVVRPGSMVEITRLPLTLIPLWLVPVLLSSHIYLLRRQVCAGRSDASPAALPKPA